MRSVLLSLAALSCFALGACGGSVDTSTTGDASVDSSHHDDASVTPVTCNGQTCGAGEVCVVTTSGGGPCMLPDDAGLCPDGKPSTGCCDNTTTTYACKPLDAECSGTLACPCATKLCQCGGCEIADAGMLRCLCMYP